MPSQAITDLHLEDLPNIKPLELTKLKRIGIESVLELATSIPQDLADDIGDKVESMSILIVEARKALSNIGLLSKEFCTIVCPIPLILYSIAPIFFVTTTIQIGYIFY